MIKPKALKPGDTIGVVAPASPTTEEALKKSCRVLKDMGFRIKMGRSPNERYGYLSGSDLIRAMDINAMFEDKEIDGIICLRGGYGTPRILDLLDYHVIRRNPKVFVGYSDITALHIVFNQLCGLVTYHGPMISSDMIGDFKNFTKNQLLNTIMDNRPLGKLDNPDGIKINIINGGVAEGIIVGGNLSLIVNTIGTPYEINTKGKILFIEEVGEEYYSIDRMFNQLRLSGKLYEANGIVLGSFTECTSVKYKEYLTLKQIIYDHIKPIGKPTIYNLQAGHCNPMITLPFGVRSLLNANKGELTILESCVE